MLGAEREHQCGVAVNVHQPLVDLPVVDHVVGQRGQPGGPWHNRFRGVDEHQRVVLVQVVRDRLDITRFEQLLPLVAASEDVGARKPKMVENQWGISDITQSVTAKVSVKT